MIMRNKWVQADFGSTAITLEFSITKARITLTPDEARGLFLLLGPLFEDAPPLPNGEGKTP